MEWFLGIMAVAGMISSAWGSYQEGQDAKQASDYNAQIARQNSEMQASMIETSGALDVARQEKQSRKFIGTQKAGYAGAGVELSGSPLDVMIGTAGEFELDKQIAEYNYKSNAYATRYTGRSQATYDEKMGNIYATSGNMKAGSTLLTQGSQIGANYYGGKYKPSTKTDTGY